MSNHKEYDPKKWDWWKDALAGKPVPLHADKAMQGYYAFRTASKQMPIPMAIWYVGDELKCKIGDTMQPDGIQYWLNAMRTPITHHTYKAVMAGEPWPEEIRITRSDGSTDSTMVGHNAADDDEKIFGDIQEWMDMAARALKKGTPETQADADALSDIATKLRDLCNEADERRLRTTKPLRDKVEEINGIYNDRIRPGKQKATDCLTAVNVYIKAEQKKREEEAKKLRDLAAQQGIDPAVISDEPVKVRTGTRKTVSTVSRQVLSITDYPAVMTDLAKRNPPSAFTEAMERWVFMLMKAGEKVPGAKLETVEGVR